MNDNKDRLKGAGYRLTKPRAAIFMAFSGSCQLLTPEEVFEHVKAKDARINLSTVYRNLDTLTKLGILKKTVLKDGRVRYETANEGSCHHHLVCSGCGSVVGFSECELADLESQLEAKTNYIIHSHNLEIYGTCPKCQAR